VTQGGFNQIPGQFSQPPTQPYAPVVGPRPSSWPSVLGIMAIVWGALGTMNGCMGSLTPFLMSTFASFIPKEQAGLTEALEEYLPWTVALALIMTALGILLIVGGAGLLKHSRFAIKTCLAWAWLKIMAVVASSVMQYFIQQAQKEQMKTMLPDDPNIPNFLTDGTVTAFALAMVGLGLAFHLGLSLFIIIWFKRQKIKDEVSQWGREHSQPVTDKPPVSY